MGNRKALENINLEKEKLRLRLQNLQRVLKVFGAEIAKNHSVLPNAKPELLFKWKQASNEVSSNVLQRSERWFIEY